MGNKTETLVKSSIDDKLAVDASWPSSHVLAVPDAVWQQILEESWSTVDKAPQKLGNLALEEASGTTAPSADSV